MAKYLKINGRIRKKKIKSVILLSVYLLFFTIFSNSYTEHINNNFPHKNLGSDTLPNKNLESSDVAGSDLYAEQISAFVAGDSSLIRQSFITNDSNIFKNLDFNDPGFINCSMMIAASNGIEPQIFPLPVGNSVFSSENFVINRPFFGFLLYNDTEGSNEVIQNRANRVLKIIKNAFNMQIILLNSTDDPNFFPFIGYYPNWNIMLDVMTSNAPLDGYWGTLDINRLSSNVYYENFHISSVILMLDSVDYLLETNSLIRKYLNFDISEFSLPFLDTGGIIDIFSTTFGTLNGSSNQLGGANVDSFLTTDSKILAAMVHYEGNEQSIENTGINQYEFDLFKAINYDYEIKGALKPSEKIFISFLGALMTEIDISIFSSEVLATNPWNFNLSEYLIESIELISFLTDQDFNIEDIENYSIGPSWISSNGVSQLTGVLQNLVDPADILNLLSIFTGGGGGTAFLPTGILNPIDEEFVTTYKIENSEPILLIEKELISYPLDTGNYQTKITVTNRGNVTAWGQDIGSVIDFNDILQIPTLIDEFIQEIHPEVEDSREYLSKEGNPRFFFIDSGTGIADYIYPDFTNLDSIVFYNEEVALEIMNSSYNYFFLVRGMDENDKQDLADSITNPDSIMNPDHWKINPGENITYTTAVSSLTQYYDYDLIKLLNFTNSGDLEPLVTYGSPSETTIVDNAHEFDKNYWNITSETIGEQNFIQILFSFKNSTNINLEKHNIDRLQFQASYFSNSTYLESNLEFFNLSINDFGSFQEIPFNNTDGSNQTIAYSAFTNLSDYFDPLDDYRMLFRLTFSSNESILLSMDSLNVSFADRKLSQVLLPSATVTYTTFSGNTTYTVESNEIIAVTDYAPLLLAKADLEHFNSFPGEINKFYLNITNLGFKEAKNLNISLEIPGKIKDAGNFTLIDGFLEIFSLELHPNKTYEFWFEFYTPNSILIPTVTIEYENFENVTVEITENFKDSEGIIDWGSEGAPRGEGISISQLGGEIQVISNYSDHENVVEIYDVTAFGSSSLKYSYSQNISTDAIEFWITSNSPDKFNLTFYDSNASTGPYVYFEDHRIKVYDGISIYDLSSYSKTYFSHIRIEFNCTSDRFQFFINGTSYGEFNFVNNLDNISYFEFATGIVESNYKVLVDAIGIESLGYKSWNNFNETMGAFIIHASDLFISAPITYDSNNSIPFVDLISINFNSNFPDSHLMGGTAPNVRELIQLEVKIKNLGNLDIPDLILETPGFISGFDIISNSTLIIDNLPGYSEENFIIQLNKTLWNAFFYEGFIINGSQYPILRWMPIVPQIFGYLELNISKGFEDIDGEQGSLIKVTLNITNNGNLIAKDISVNDVSGFSRLGFSLYSGVIDKASINLSPGENFQYSYILKFDKQGTYIIPPAVISYEYLYFRVAESKSLLVKIRNTPINILFVLIPSLLGLIITAGLYLWKNRYDRESAEFDRREELLFGEDYRSRAWDKNIIEEQLNKLENGNVNLRESEGKSE